MEGDGLTKVPLYIVGIRCTPELYRCAECQVGWDTVSELSSLVSATTLPGNSDEETTRVFKCVQEGAIIGVDCVRHEAE
ncbi:hypothetical protein RUM43_010572 [Polyplax serrata]|uniref:Uncharacterized protein n=1 Tax=Polyplax serrata TaxID=468196 RepID=A0AAN8P4F0_POLSC